MITTATVRPALFAMAAFALATPGHAQVFGSPDPGNRAGRWDVYGGLRWVLSEDVTFDGSSTIDTDDDLGFAFGFGYNFNDHLQLGGELTWASIDYEGTLKSADDPPEDDLRLSGEFDALGISANLVYHFLKGPFTPYVSASLGYVWIDTNIADGPPELGCWWDPWFGQVCALFQDTKNEDSVTYGVGAGLRWEFARGWFGRVGYDERFVDIGSARGTPGFGSVRLDIGSRF